MMVQIKEMVFKIMELTMLIPLFTLSSTHKLFIQLVLTESMGSVIKRQVTLKWLDQLDMRQVIQKLATLMESMGLIIKRQVILKLANLME